MKEKIESLMRELNNRLVIQYRTSTVNRSFIDQEEEFVRVASHEFVKKLEEFLSDKENIAVKRVYGSSALENIYTAELFVFSESQLFDLLEKVLERKC